MKSNHGTSNDQCPRKIEKTPPQAPRLVQMGKKIAFDQVRIVDVCSFVRHRLCPPGWQRMGDDDFAVPSVFSEDETMWRTIVGAL